MYVCLYSLSLSLTLFPLVYICLYVCLTFYKVPNTCLFYLSLCSLSLILYLPTHLSIYFFLILHLASPHDRSLPESSTPTVPGATAVKTDGFHSYQNVPLKVGQAGNSHPDSSPASGAVHTSREKCNYGQGFQPLWA